MKMIKYSSALPLLLIPIVLFFILSVRAESVVSSSVVDSSVMVELIGLAEAQGNIYISVYDSRDKWLGEDTVTQMKIAIAEALDGEILHTTIELPPGEYAFFIYYDINGNGALDTNFIGIPREPVALSNNARPKFGPPKYKNAVFTLGAEPVIQQIVIEAI